MLVETRGTGLGSGVERKIVSANGFPIVGAFVKRVDIELRVARRVAKRFDDGIEIGLTGAAAHGGDGAVGDIDTGIGGFEDGGGVDAAGVVSVKVDRKGALLHYRFT